MYVVASLGPLFAVPFLWSPFSWWWLSCTAPVYVVCTSAVFSGRGPIFRGPVFAVLFFAVPFLRSSFLRDAVHFSRSLFSSPRRLGRRSNLRTPTRTRGGGPQQGCCGGTGEVRFPVARECYRFLRASFRVASFRVASFRVASFRVATFCVRTSHLSRSRFFGPAAFSRYIRCSSHFSRATFREPLFAVFLAGHFSRSTFRGLYFSVRPLFRGSFDDISAPRRARPVRRGY